jgi:thymidylate synthase
MVDHNDLGKLGEEECKRYVKAVLEAKLNGPLAGKKQADEKYFGCKSFGDMSKQIGKEWKHVDKVTRSVFKDLAREASKRRSAVSLYLRTVFALLCLVVSHQTDHYAL